MSLSKTQIDRLGDRLKTGRHSESDLRLLDDFRRSFGEAYGLVIHTIRQRGLFPSGRSAKSTLSIMEKLRRESWRALNEKLLTRAIAHLDQLKRPEP